jgi:AAA+ superfamily predicted ATPase
MPASTERIAAVEIVPFRTGAEHLLAELERLALLVHAEIIRMRAINLLTENQFRGLYVSDEQIDSMMRSALQGKSNKNSDNNNNNNDSPEASAIRTLAMLLAECEQLIAARCAASRGAGVALPLENLASIFSLSRPESDALLLTLAPEVDARFETLYSYAQNDVTRKRPTVGLILRLLASDTASHLELRSLFSAAAPLLGNPLLRFSDDAPDREAALLSRPLKPEERIVEFLLGRESIDCRLRPFTTFIHPDADRVSLHFPAGFVEEIGRAASILQARKGGVLFFHGPSGGGRRSMAEALSAKAGRGLVVADLRQAHAAGAATPVTLSLLRREARLSAANILLTHVESWLAEGEGAKCQPHQPSIWDALEDSTDEPASWPSSAGEFVSVGRSFAAKRGRESAPRDLGLIVFAASESPWPISAGAPRSPWTAFAFPVPDFSSRSKIWQQAMAAAGSGDQPEMAAMLANQFVLTGGQIHAACRMARNNAQLRGRDASELTGEDFQAAARAQSNQSLGRRARKVETAHGWDDLVLPPRTLQQLREVCAAEKYRSFIFAEWGFDRRLVQGKGLNVLFWGVSGTGKTMSAGIVARELGLDLYKIDLSSVISKYIGETEKHLSEIFREAQSSNAILFFDEADAIFGKRSEVKDAHDRYANVEVAYLLQKMEEYEGVVILASNFRRNIDDAFTRRIQYIVEFPFPEPKYRERIWRGLIPVSAPLSEDVDFGFLARQFELAGGNIRNAALVAAFLAAEEGGKIRMEHFVLATARELQKLGKLPSRSDFKEYYDLTRERI